MAALHVCTSQRWGSDACVHLSRSGKAFIQHEEDAAVTSGLLLFIISEKSQLIFIYTNDTSGKAAPRAVSLQINRYMCIYELIGAAS